jgi:hypothetical protein
VGRCLCVRAVGKIGSGTARRIWREEEFVTEADMPPPEKPKPRRQEGEQEHLREDAGTTRGGLGPGVEPAEHLKEDATQEQARPREEGKGLIDKAKDKLKGS